MGMTDILKNRSFLNFSSPTCFSMSRQVAQMRLRLTFFSLFLVPNDLWSRNLKSLLWRLRACLRSRQKSVPLSANFNQTHASVSAPVYAPCYSRSSDSSSDSGIAEQFSAKSPCSPMHDGSFWLPPLLPFRFH